jgi:hypothetical protein
MITDIIQLKQLPIIEEQLHQIKEQVTAATNEALSLVCTDETVKTVKQKRADLNKAFAAFEERRKEIKAEILAPYDAFEKVYRDCVTEPFKTADTELAEKIADVENGLKNEKYAALSEYFNEYRNSIGLSEEDATLYKARINVTLSASLKSLKDKATAYLDQTLEDLQMIDLQEYRDEILSEYRKTGNAAQSITIVNQRHKEIEEERRRAEERRAAEEARAAAAAKVEEAIAETAAEAAAAPQDAFMPPIEETPAETDNSVETPADAPAEIYESTFTVWGTLEQLKALKKFLDENNYDYK